jgi:hypothetical protein
MILRGKFLRVLESVKPPAAGAAVHEKTPVLLAPSSLNAEATPGAGQDILTTAKFERC